jgi:enoyl-CoA hydratase/carnithine racemase
MPEHSQFNIDRTYPGLWTITFSNPPINMFVQTTIVDLGALMTDLEADPSVKVVVFQSVSDWSRGGGALEWLPRLIG